MILFPNHPYLDDFDDAKGFLQILFNPGRPVQARELTQIQTILKNQLRVFGRHVFQHGSPVIGGELTEEKVRFHKLESEFEGNPINVEEFLGAIVVEPDTGNRGKVVFVHDATEDDPETIYVKMKEGREFTPGNTIMLNGSTIGAVIEDDEGAVGDARYLGINEGYFFIEGDIAFCAAQDMIVSKYSNVPSGRGGLLYNIEVVTPAEDQSLLDNAQGSNNYAGAGADRYKIDLTLTYIHTNDPVPDNFVSLITHESGTNTEIIRHPLYDIIGKEMARRTFDESGHYTVSPFKLNVTEAKHYDVIRLESDGTTITAVTAQVNQLETGSPIIISGVTGEDAEIYNGEHTVTSVLGDGHEFTFTVSSSPSGHADANNDDIRLRRPDHFAAVLSPGKAYVKGFEHEKIANKAISIPKARTTREVQNYPLHTSFGQYVIVKDMAGLFDIPDLQHVNLYDAEDGNGTLLGTAKVRYLRYHSAGRWRLYIYDLNLSESFGFSDVRSLETVGGGSIANVADESIDDGDAFLSAQTLNTLIFPIPHDGVATLEPGGQNNNSFTYQKAMGSQLVGNNLTLTLAGNEFFRGPININFSQTDAHLHHYIFVDDADGSVLDVDTITLSTDSQQLTVGFSGVSDINVSALCSVNIQGHPTRTKTLATETINVPDQTITKNDPKFSLGYPDVVRIISITEGLVDITNRFIFDNGQRDNFYDHASITLRPGANPPGGDIDVEIEYFQHTGDGYFSIDSYQGIEREDIPVYTSPTTGYDFDLANCLDFRPVRQIGDTVHTNPKLTTPNTVFSTDYEFYLPRRDIIVMRPNGEFEDIQGEPDTLPQFPSTPEFSMKLYMLEIPAYTSRIRDITSRFVENKRFTMRDIGRLERRIKRLEYYTSLSLLEMDTKGTPVFDADGFERFKNGFIVDAFTGHSVGDVRSPDYKCAIDAKKNELRPPFVSRDVTMIKQSTTNIVEEGNEDIGIVYTLPYTLEPHFLNEQASRRETVNPYLVIDIEGRMITNPTSDFWVDTEHAPDVHANLSGDFDNWEWMEEAIIDELGEGWGTEWGEWETVWLGDWEDIGREHRETIETNWWRQPMNNWRHTVRVTQDQRQQELQQRTGTQTSIDYEEVEVGLGERVINVNIIPYMREQNLMVMAEGLRPNRDMHVFFDDEKMNENVTPNPGFEAQSEGVVRSNEDGELRFSINIPGGEFHTGVRLLRVIDDRQNIIDNATTYADYHFHSEGLLQTKNEAILSTRQPVITTNQFTENRTQVNHRTTVREIADVPGCGDPIAQNFFVDEILRPEGIFIKRATLYFGNKPGPDDNEPVEVQIRPTVNAYPHHDTVMPFGNVFVKREDVVIPPVTDDIEVIREHGTVFEFPAPVYLEPGKEYSLIVLSNSSEYEIYTGVMGQKEFGTDNTIMQHAGLSSMFKSQNATTWTAFQDENMMLKIERCVFDTESQGTLNYQANHINDIPANLINYNAEILDFPSSTVRHEFQIRDANTQNMSDWAVLNLGTNVYLPTEKTINSNDSLLVRTTLGTDNVNVAPMVEANRNHTVCVHNIVNNLGLNADGFIIMDPGENYTSEPSVEISGGGGSGAVAEAHIENGSLSEIVLIEPGQGYTSAPTISISGGGGTSGAVIYEGVETDPNGGNAIARYITRPITLVRDWHTDFLTTMLDVNLPSGTGIRVFYKVLAEDDPQSFQERPWVQMVPDFEGDVFSENPDHFIEVSYVPPEDTVAYEWNDVTFTHIKNVAVKIVMTSNNTSRVPRIRDFRTITTAP